MANYVNLRNLKFLLYEVFDAESLTRYEHFKDHDRASFDMILDTAKQIADNLLYPTYREMDAQEPQLENGVVRVHPAIGKYLRATMPMVADKYLQWCIHWQVLCLVLQTTVHLCTRGFLRGRLGSSSTLPVKNSKTNMCLKCFQESGRVQWLSPNHKQVAHFPTSLLLPNP